MQPLRISILSALVFGNAYAGVYVESVTHDKAAKQLDATQKMYIQDGMARMESSERGTVTIFKGDTMFVLDAARKTYTAIDAATLNQTMSAMNDMMQKMQANLAKMPPEQRAAIEQSMKQSGLPMAGASAKPAMFDATPSNTTEKAAGYTCKVWNITLDGTPNSQVCVVAYAGLPGKDDVQALATKMSVLLEKLPESLRGQYNGNPLQQGNKISAKLNGVPFITRGYRNGALDSKETVVKIWQEQAVAAAQFEIPDGYVKQELPALRKQ